MARTRNLKPDFFLDDELAELPALTRILFQGLWVLADREGRLSDRPKKIKAQVLPYDEHDVDVALDDLHKAGFIQRYESENKKYIQVHKFIKHQNPHHKEVASCIPAPQGHQDSGAAPCEVTPGQRQRILDRDGNVCLSCGVTQDLEIDHIIPVSKGGTSEDTNLQTLCGKCNASKGNRHQRAVNEPLTSQAQTKQGASRTPLTLNPSSLTLNPCTSNFDAWWKTYPNKVGKKPAQTIWKRIKPDSDLLIADVERRMQMDHKWREGFIPNPTTYLNQERWNDDISIRPCNPAQTISTPQSRNREAIENHRRQNHEAPMVLDA